MQQFLSPNSARKPSIFFVVFLLFLLTLWVAGGASRADVAGQLIVRIVAIIALAISAVFGAKPSVPATGAVGWIVLAALVLALLQLVPLPPGVWQSLPGRELIVRAAQISAQDQPWRPWSIVPGATLNAAASLLVPLAVLVLISQLSPTERQLLPGSLLVAIIGCMFVGILQVAGLRVDNPLINEQIGQITGTFANRNHFALFLACGCVLAPVWAFNGRREAGWRGPAALGLVLLFELLILACGSRAGLVLGILALAVGCFLARRSIKAALERYSRWVRRTLAISIVGAIALLAWISVRADRAMSIYRLMELDTGEDLRRRALPTVVEMVRVYFPAGSGLGGFDPVFRIHEPVNLLAIAYFNHAHNDFLEVVLDAGFAGLLLLAAALLWWVWATLRAWRSGATGDEMLPRLGSAILLLVMAASVVDYPARTPMIMAVLVLAGAWLADQSAERRHSALPSSGQTL